ASSGGPSRGRACSMPWHPGRSAAGRPCRRDGGDERTAGACCDGAAFGRTGARGRGGRGMGLHECQAPCPGADRNEAGANASPLVSHATDRSLGADRGPQKAICKDTVLVRTGEVVEILLDVTNPGLWMAHCHIAEHHESGMMFSFNVSPGNGEAAAAQAND